jgi:hypothetical protein
MSVYRASLDEELAIVYYDYLQEQEYKNTLVFDTCILIHYAAATRWDLNEIYILHTVESIGCLVAMD